MNKKIGQVVVGLVSGSIPLVAAAINPIPEPAQGGFSIDGFIASIFGLIWPLFLAIAVLIFIYAGFLFLTANGNDAKIVTAKKSVLWGIAGVAVALLSSSIPWIISGLIST